MKPITEKQPMISPNVDVNQLNAQHWALTLGRYLSNRTKHIQQAYQQPKPNDQTLKNVSMTRTPEPMIEQVVLFALASELEAGHTVMTLNQEDWQSTLLNVLLAPLQLDVVSPDEILAMNPIDVAKELTTDIPLDNKPHEVRAKIEHRIALAQGFVQYVQCNDINSLSSLLSNLFWSQSSDNEHQTQYPIVLHKHVDRSSGEIEHITLWLHRTWQAERKLAQALMRLNQQAVEPLPLSLNVKLNPEQRQAIEIANTHPFSLITGGPGTGKTFTVAQLVMALQQKQDEYKQSEHKQSSDNHLALVAPTGKAAQRMQESLQSALNDEGIQMALPDAKTIHRLLGIGQDGMPRYSANNPLSEDIIIVDEASMLGVELASQLVQAVKVGARLILLGDAHQLSAVDAGAVLADLCATPALQDSHQALTQSRRFTAESGVGQLATLINQQADNSKKQDAVLNLLATHKDLAFIEVSQMPQPKLIAKLQDGFTDYVNLTNDVYATLANKHSRDVYASEECQALFEKYQYFRILCASHHGRLGVSQVNASLSTWQQKQSKRPMTGSDWYHGRPVMVQQNTYELGVFNGDVGICLQTKQGLQVFFEGQGRGISINQLSDNLIKTAYAMTIHKSQGSEFNKVAVCFDDTQTQLLSRELIYTAVTRAKKQVDIFSTQAALKHAMATPTVRRTGLGLQFKALESST